MQQNRRVDEALDRTNLSQLQKHWQLDGSHDNFLDRDVATSQAFDIEKERVYTDVEMRKDIVSYLSEYRLRVQKYDYELLYSFREGEGFRVRDVHRGEAMSIKAKRTLAERQVTGLPIHREMAEDEGIENLDKQLYYAQDGDKIFWISPPGPKEEGYGNYGFVFEGRVQNEMSEDGLPTKRLFMSAIRVENPTMSQANSAFSELTGENISHASPEGLLENPRVVSKRAVDTDAVLQKNFSFVVNQRDAWTNSQVITKMNLMIDEAISVIRSGTREERIRSFYALENYALALKERFTRENDAPEKENIVYTRDYGEYRYLADILYEYGYMPPIVAGSCGATGEEVRSNDIFADSYSDLMKAIFGDLREKFGIGVRAEDDPNLCRCSDLAPHFHCPGNKKDGTLCRHPIIVGKGTTACISCGAGKMC